MGDEATRRFFSGNTIEQALVAAASHYHVAPEQIAYSRVERRHGFVRVQRRVVIEVDPEQPVKREAPEPRPEPARQEPPAARPAAPPPAAARPAVTHPFPARPAAPSGSRPERTPRPRAVREPRPDRPRREGDRPRERPAAGSAAPARPALAPAELLPAAEEALGRILALAGLDLRADLRVSEGRLEGELAGPDRSRILEEEGELLQAIEYLLPRVLRAGGGESIHCRLDSGGFRSRREEELQQLARRTADEVRASGRPVVLDPLGPGERRIVHLTLAEDPQVETASDGDGFFKRITIRLRG